MTGALPALLEELQAAPWATEAVSELRAVLPDAADTLQAALHARADAAACETVVAALFSRAEEGVGWTEPFWRECYVLACAATAFALCAAPGGDRQRALRHLDCAFIMGGPPEVLQPFVAEVEPLVPRTVTIDAHLLPRSLPDGEAPELLAASRLCRLGSGEWGRFRKEFYNVDAPVVLAGLGAAWPALEKWRDLGFWDREFGHRYVPLEVGKHTDGSAWREEVAPMCEFLAALAAGTRVLYLAQHTLFEHLPVLRKDFEVPDCVGRRLTRINAWLGSRGTVTPLHYDRRVAARTPCGWFCPIAFVHALTIRCVPQLRRAAHPGSWLQVRAALSREQHTLLVSHKGGVGSTTAVAGRRCRRRCSRRRWPGHH